MEPAMIQLYTENRAQFDAKVREHVQKVGMIEASILWSLSLFICSMLNDMGLISPLMMCSFRLMTYLSYSSKD